MNDTAAQPPTNEELLTAARRYAAAGLKIYPVRIPGLKPDGKKDVKVPFSWSENATDDLATVESWWSGPFAGYGIGVDMGRSHLAVVDADVKNGVDGIQRAALELNGAAGVVSRTPSGGVHVWYSDPAGEVGSGSNIFGDKDHPSGVDARGVGGTIFMPPTFVPGYGRYEWADDRPPDFTALPVAPSRLAAACPPGGRKKAAPAPDPAAPFATSSQLFADSYRPADQQMTIERAKARLLPLWEAVRDTKSPNGLWQAVAGFARAAAHFQCFWDRAWVERMVLAAYREGGHGYAELDADDLRAISSAYALQDQAREAGDLDEGWVALAPEPEQPPNTDDVDALLAEMLSPEQMEQMPPPKHLIRGVLTLDSESWLIGEPGSKKSFVALDIAAHVSLGRPWQGRKTTQGPVVMIVAEGAAGSGKRVKAWLKEHGQMGGVRFLPRPVQAKDIKAWRVLVEACRRIEPVMVVLDTQARVTVGLEENSATEMGIYVEAVRAIREATGACVLTVHHTGRKGGDARGSSALDGAQSTELTVVPAGADKLRASLKITKQKDIDEEPDIPLYFKIIDMGVDEEGVPINSLVLMTADAWQAAQLDADDVLEPGQEVRVQEPQPWTFKIFEHHRQTTERRILQVMADLYVEGGQGHTESKILSVVLGTWFDGRPVSAKGAKGHLKAATWQLAWQRVTAAEEAASGERVAVNVRGERWALNPMVIRT